MVPGFDTSLGTLTGFSFQLSGTLSRTVFVNRSEQPLVGTFANTVSVIGSNDGVISLPDAAASGPAGNEITGAVPISFSATLTPGFLASIAPGADIDLNLIFGGRLTFNGSLGASSERIGFSGPIQVTETFTFTPVPEPVSLSLLGMGVVGLAALRRKSSGNAAI